MEFEKVDLQIKNFVGYFYQSFKVKIVKHLS